MALARVVSFEGVDGDRIASLKQEIESGERPADVPATEMLVLHDAATEQRARDRLLRLRGRLRDRRRGSQRDASGRHAGTADVRDEVRRRRSHDLVAQQGRSRGPGVRQPPRALRQGTECLPGRPG